MANRLTSDHVGGDVCLRPSAENLTLSPIPTSACIWHGFTELAESLKDRHFDWQGNITLNDGPIKRQITRQQSTVSDPDTSETWALGVHIAASRTSRVLADEWVLATTNATTAQGNGKFSSLEKAADGLGVAKVQTWLPVARTFCERYEGIGASTQSINYAVCSYIGHFGLRLTFF